MPCSVQPVTDRWRGLLAVTGLYALAVALGLGSAWLALRGGAGLGESVGPWQVNTLTGSTQADLYTRARVAVGGLLALSRSETMYYVARTDSSGQPLRSRCRYRIQGMPPPARWWSVTAYAEDFFLFPARQARYSLNAHAAVPDAQGRFTLLSTPEEPAPGEHPHAWLHTPGDRGLMFTLRLYHPHDEVSRAPARLEAPVITRLGDCPP